MSFPNVFPYPDTVLSRSSNIPWAIENESGLTIDIECEEFKLTLYMERSNRQVVGNTTGLPTTCNQVQGYSISNKRFFNRKEIVLCQNDLLPT